MALLLSECSPNDSFCDMRTKQANAQTQMYAGALVAKSKEQSDVYMVC